MTAFTPNLDWLTQELAVGGSFPMHAAEVLARELSIRHVVDVRSETCDVEHVLRKAGLTLLHLPTEDYCAVSQHMLDRGVRWVRERLERREKVYIHCEHGIGRSALLACCVLVSFGHSPLEALTRAKDVRAVVSPSPEQLGALLTWSANYMTRENPSWQNPTLEALQNVAYRHLRNG